MGSVEEGRGSKSAKEEKVTILLQDIEPWVREVTTEFFAPIVGDTNAAPEKIYVAATVDQGGTMVNAFRALRVPVLICTGHRLNSSINWGLGISGSWDKTKATGTCKNLVLRELVAVMTALAAVFSHSPCNNDAFKDVQTELDDMCRALGVLRRNDTRWGSVFAMMKRELRLYAPLQVFFSRNLANRTIIKRQPTPAQWQATREVVSVLADASLVSTQIQGGPHGFVGKSINSLYVLLSSLALDTQDILRLDPFDGTAEETPVSQLLGEFVPVLVGSEVPTHLRRSGGVAEKGHTMWDMSSMAKPLLVLCLMTWRCGHGAEAGSHAHDVGPGGVVAEGQPCPGEYVTVADTTGFPIAGCYRKTVNHGDGGGTSYVNYEGKLVGGRPRQPVVMWDMHVGGTDESTWGIGNGEVGEPPSTMCTSRSGAGLEGWECNDGAIFQELVTCGCSPSEQQASERYHAAWVDAQGGGGSSEGGMLIWGSDSGGGRRNRMRGGGKDSRDKGVALVVGAGGGGVVSRVLASGELHSFWRWVIIAGSIAGGILLCLIAWYIMNPFFCQKDPPADPNAQPEDVAPQAPKTAFQPWGASAPPGAPSSSPPK
eukprot:g11956.t1